MASINTIRPLLIVALTIICPFALSSCCCFMPWLATGNVLSNKGPHMQTLQQEKIALDDTLILLSRESSSLVTQ